MPLFAEIDWLNLLQTFGLAVTILGFVGFCAWRGAHWFAKEIVIPLRDQALMRFVNFLDRIEKTVNKLDTNVDTVTTNLQQQTLALQGVQESNTKIQEGTGELVVAIKGGHTKLEDTVADAVKKAETRHTEILAELKLVHAEYKELAAKIEKLTPL